ncbi:hypothetical protein Tco_1417782 [Tanacetum coccineum]
MTWFDLFLKSDIDKDENHILRPSTVTIANKFKELIQKDELTIADLKGAELKWLKVQYNNDVELEYHVCQLSGTLMKEMSLNRYHLNDTCQKVQNHILASTATTTLTLRSDDKECEFCYADLPRLSVNDVEDMYLLQVQDKLHHLPLEFVKDFNNALLMFIRRTVIKKRVEDIQYGVKAIRELSTSPNPQCSSKESTKGYHSR